MLGVGDEHPRDTQPPVCPTADLGHRRVLSPDTGGVSRGADPPSSYLVFPLHPADADVVLVRTPRQLLGGAENPTWGWGEACRPPRAPPEPPSTYPVVAHLAGTAGLQAHPVDVVPGEGDRGVTTLMGCPPTSTLAFCWGAV